MVKGITILRKTSTPAVFDRLAHFFTAMGLEQGKGWDNDLSRGAPFLAPIGNLEFVDGMISAPADVLVEVTSLDDVRTVAEGWVRKHFAEEQWSKVLSEITATDWGSRIFRVEPVPGVPFAFWQSENPLHGKPVAIEGDLSAAGMKFAVVVARWNAVITDRLLQGAYDCLLRSGAAKADIALIRVPGAWEIPSAARTIAEQGGVDAVITLGVLLRGETAHYEAIYTEVARGIGQSQQETGVPHAFGVLTCETLEQALDRAGLKAGNKGFEAASAAVEMVSITRKVKAGEKDTATVAHAADPVPRAGGGD